MNSIKPNGCVFIYNVIRSSTENTAVHGTAPKINIIKNANLTICGDLAKIPYKRSILRE